MTIAIKTPEWTVKVMDAESKAEWTYKVLRGAPTTKDVQKALKSINK